MVGTDPELEFSYHEWKILDAPAYPLPFSETKRASDVHQCSRCGQICLSEVGGEPDDEFIEHFVKDCRTTMVKHVMES